MVILPPIEVVLVGCTKAVADAILKRISGLDEVTLARIEMYEGDDNDDRVYPGTLICALYRGNIYPDVLRDLINAICDKYKTPEAPEVCETCHAPLQLSS